MNSAHGIRVFAHAYTVFVESLASHWITSVIPVIATVNFKITDNSEKSGAASKYFIWYFVGLIAGSFIWPLVVRYMSKRSSIFLGLALQGVFNFLVGASSTFGWMCFWRFFFGASHVVNSIGKDFVYDFASHSQRQFVFSMRSVAIFTSCFIGPLLGYYVYYATGRSLTQTLTYISMLYITACLAQLIVFFWMEQAHHSHEVHPEETHHLTAEDGDIHHEVHVAKKAQIGIWTMVKYIAKNQSLRNLVLGYCLVFAVYNTQLFLVVFYVETAWKDDGLGLTDREVSYIVMAVFFPIVLFFFLSSKLIPKHMSIYTLFKIIIFSNIGFLVIVPGFRDWGNGLDEQTREPIIYAFSAIFMTLNPNLISPFLNFTMNNRIPKNGRTTFNALTFLGVSLAVIGVFSTVVPLFSQSMFDPEWTAHRPYNKYVCFAALDVLLGIGAYLLRKPDEHKD